MGSVQLQCAVHDYNRNVELSGILLDGTPFSFNLNSSRIVGKDYFDKGAFLTVTFVPEPSYLALLALALPLFTRRQNRVRRNLRS